MAKKVIKKLTGKPSKKKKLQLPEFEGVQMAEIGERIVMKDGNDIPIPGDVRYNCRFIDGSWKMVPEELLKKFIK